ncbi:nuclear transport factor 2 family protein [Winogradskyella sp. 3972H.M.0a.05]|uniref:nuclear transport factor 2 family protein n=1 Tax=Winogradskyella sp. 3972H.M.0a.05 TaxID=2950277 RepID=UPI003396565A
MEPKDVVRGFYESDLANNTEALATYLHPECQLNWHSSKGYHQFDFNKVNELFTDIHRSYESIRMHISHMLQDGDFVTTRYTMMVRTIEDPDNEEPMAHFITIWEVKDGKLYKGYEISQLADVGTSSLNSFTTEKV